MKIKNFTLFSLLLFVLFFFLTSLTANAESKEALGDKILASQASTYLAQNVAVPDDYDPVAGASNMLDKVMGTEKASDVVSDLQSVYEDIKWWVIQIAVMLAFLSALDPWNKLNKLWKKIFTGFAPLDPDK